MRSDASDVLNRILILHTGLSRVGGVRKDQ